MVKKQVSEQGSTKQSMGKQGRLAAGEMHTIIRRQAADTITFAGGTLSKGL
jgi:hypothetical protein